MKAQRATGLTAAQRAEREVRAVQASTDLETLGTGLALRTAAVLHRSLTAPGGPRPIDRAQLQTCIQHAGLARTLGRLPVGELTEHERLHLDSILYNLGAHTGTLLTYLAVPEGHRREAPDVVVDGVSLEPQAAPSATLRRMLPLLDLMFPRARHAALCQADAALDRAEAALCQARTGGDREDIRLKSAELAALRVARSNEKATAFQQAVAVSRAFGYSETFPAWKFMGSRNMGDHNPRVKALTEVASSNEARLRKGPGAPASRRGT